MTSVTQSVVLLGGLLLAQPEAAPKLELVEPVRKVWDRGPHNAFTDLIRFKDRWVCVFREGTGHAAGAGKIRVLNSDDGKEWQSAALIEQDGVDLRDSHLSITPDGSLMVVGGAAVPPSRDPLKDHYSFVALSKDGKEWTRPERVSESWHWLWRVTWHEGRAYGIAYEHQPKNARKFGAALLASDDPRSFKRVAEFGVPNATEATLAFDGARMLCLQRRDGKPNSAMLGASEPPYKDWTWKDLGVYFGGPNFLRIPDGTWLAAGRLVQDGKPRTVVCRLDVKEGKLHPLLTLPSGGDNSYPGLVWHDDQLWVSYYSSHEGKSNIYLARLKVVKGK
jgi:hypothetical protein